MITFIFMSTDLSFSILGAVFIYVHVSACTCVGKCA